MTAPKTVRLILEQILSQAQTPLSSVDLAVMLACKHGIHVNTASVGVNLGYLRAAGVVDRRTCPVWGKPYFWNRQWRFQTENLWWHTKAIAKSEALAFIRKRRMEVEWKATENQRRKGRPVTVKRPPRTDDMRQMIEDLRINRMGKFQ